MLNLIKYEWLRRWKFFLSGIIVFLAANIDQISRLTKRENPSILTGALIAILFALWVALMIDHLGRLYRTLFTDEGLLELTLPLNGYQFLGAKLLAIALEFGAVMIFVAFVAYLDLMYINRAITEWQLAPITGELVLEALQVMGLSLGIYLMFILIIYISLTLAKSLFASFKHGKLIAFGSFLIIAKIVDYVMNLWNVKNGYNIHQPGFNIAASEWMFIIVIIGLLFSGTAYLLDRKVNL